MRGIMFGQRAAENMPAGTLGDEKDIIVRFGVQRRHNRRAPRIGNRPSGKPSHAVCVIRIDRVNL